jgi:hypothetical protein
MRLLNKRPSELMKPAKVDLIDFAFDNLGVRSFADLGGVWGVEGGYTFHALDNHDVDQAFLVDTHPTSKVLDKAQKYKQLEVLKGSFGDQELVQRVAGVDAVFFFDVLLHQVSPDWDRILEMYGSQTRCLIIYNQQWTGSEKTVRLLELGEDEYFDNVPHSRRKEPYKSLFQKLEEKHPDHDRPWKDVHHVWQWGITDADLTGKLEALGFRQEFSKNFGQFGRLKNFENHAFIYCK